MAADGEWENCVRSQSAYFEGAEALLSYVQCFLYIVSSSINVSIFHIARVDTFGTGLVNGPLSVKAPNTLSICIYIEDKCRAEHLGLMKVEVPALI